MNTRFYRLRLFNYEFLITVLVILFTSLLNSCDHEELRPLQENENFRPAADFIRNNFDLTLFYAAIEHAGLVDELNSEGPFTIFAPNNQAFNAIGIYRPSDFDGLNQDSLRFMVLYHILNRRLLFADVPAGSVDNLYTNMVDKELDVSSTTKGSKHVYDALFVNGAYTGTLAKDADVANGTLHVIDKVLKYYDGTVQSFLASKLEYSMFIEGLKKFNLWDELAAEGPVTVLAVTNDVFENAGITETDIQSMRREDYYDWFFQVYILNNKHILSSDVDMLNPSTGTISNTGFSGSVELFEIGDSDYQTGLYYYTLYDNIGNYNYEKRALVLNRTLGFTLGPARGVPFSIPPKTDFVCGNGLVHNLTGPLVLPDEALKIENPQNNN